MIRLDIQVEKESRKLLQVFENNAESWLIFNGHFSFVEKEFWFLLLHLALNCVTFTVG